MDYKENDVVNLKKGKEVGFPFNHKDYVPRFIEVKKVVIKNGIEVFKTKNIDTNPRRLPEYAYRAMHPNKTPSPIYFLRNSPKNKRGKWIRPYGKFVWTQLAVELIKNGLKDSIIDPLTHKIKKGYLKIQRIFPPSKTKVSW